MTAAVPARAPMGLQQMLEQLSDALGSRHPGEVAKISLALVGDTFVITGEVVSESCKTAAKRLLLGADGVLKVRNDLVVAGYLQGASDGDVEDSFFSSGGRGAARDLSGKIVTKSWPPTSYFTRDGRIEGPGIEYASAASEPVEEVTRHPSLAVEGKIVGGGEIVAVVDLGSERQADGQTISLGRFPEGWSEIPVTVQLTSPALEIVDAMQQVLVRADAPSEPARVRCKVKTDVEPGTALPVQVYFLHGTRICGHAEWTLHAAGDGDEAVGTGPATAESDSITSTANDDVREQGATVPSAVAGGASVTIVPDAPGPTLTVVINAGDDGAQQWTWFAATPQGLRVGNEGINLKASGAVFAAGLLQACPGYGKNEFRRRMHGVGERIWKASPAQFQKELPLLREAAGSAFPVQVISNDPFVPWELMKPDGVDADHLHLVHPVARWPLSQQGTLRGKLPAGAIVSFVPRYDVNRTLPSAIEEADWLYDQLGAKIEAAKRNDFLETLDGSRGRAIGVVHFAGHGRADMGLGDAAIEFEDGWVTIDEVNQSRVQLGELTHSLVVLNACEVASETPSLGLNGGWCGALADRGFGGLVAPLWAVQDRTAFAIVKATLGNLLEQRTTLGEAMLNARRQEADQSVAALAYLAHGDVMARIE